MEARRQVYVESSSAISALQGGFPCQSVCISLQHIATQHRFGIRMWTGMWNREIRDLVEGILFDHSTPVIRRFWRAVLNFLSIFTQGLGYIWTAWRQWLLPYSAALIQCFPKIKPKFSQMSLKSFLPRSASIQEAAKKQSLKRSLVASSEQAAAPVVALSSLFASFLTTPALDTLGGDSTTAAIPRTDLQRWLTVSRQCSNSDATNNLSVAARVSEHDPILSYSSNFAAPSSLLFLSSDVHTDVLDAINDFLSRSGIG